MLLLAINWIVVCLIGSLSLYINQVVSNLFSLLNLLSNVTVWNFFLFDFACLESKMVYIAHVFESIGLGYMNRAVEPNLLPQVHSLDEQHCFWALFRSSPEVCNQLWDFLSPTKTINKLAHPKHLLWALVFLKVYASESNVVPYRSNCLNTLGE